MLAGEGGNDGAYAGAACELYGMLAGIYVDMQRAELWVTDCEMEPSDRSDCFLRQEPSRRRAIENILGTLFLKNSLEKRRNVGGNLGLHVLTSVDARLEWAGLTFIFLMAGWDIKVLVMLAASGPGR